MAKDQTEVGITGQPIPRPRTAKQQHELEKNRRKPEHLGTNVGGQQYTSGAKYYVPSTTGYNPRTRTFREFVEIAEAHKLEHKFPLSADELELAKRIGIMADSGSKPQTKPKQKVTSAERITNQENPTGGPTKVSRENRKNIEFKEESETKQKSPTQAQKEREAQRKRLIRMIKHISDPHSDVAREEYELSEMPYQIYGPGPHGSSDAEPQPLGKPYRNKKRAKTRADELDQEIGGYRHFVRKVDEENELDEVKGFGGHIDPETGKPTGKRSKSQQAHSQHWRNRQQGKDVPDSRRSKFKYGGATKSTTGSHEGDTPEGFAKKQDPGLAMTPSARMAARARSLELKGKGKQANKIRAVASRPNMSEG